MRSRREVWFLIAPRAGILNVAGPWEVFGHANDVLGRPAYELQAFSAEHPVLRTRHGLALAGCAPLPAAPRRFPHTLIVAGGSPQLPLPEDHAQTVGWLRRHKRRLGRVASICTGAFLLAEAGFLEGKRATTHWLHLHDLRRRFPGTAVVDEGVYVEDGGVWTSAGVTAGIDLALALVEADLGHATAMDVAKRMVLFLRRSGRQSQFSSALDLQTRSPSQLSSLSAFILDHLGEPLPVDRLASAAGMSPRTLSRWCREHFNESPAELVRRLRLEEARRLLAESELTLKEVAAQTGLGDPSTLWRAFTQQLAVTPAEYRQRFGALAAVAGE